MFLLKVALGFFSMISIHAANAFPTLPDDDQTTGALCTEQDKDFKEFRYDEQIPYCERNVSSNLKRSIYNSYQIPSECTARYTIDHFFPLAIGGNNSRKNLWPEHKLVKALRQNLEEEIYQAVKDGELLQQDALDKIQEAKLNPPLEKLEPSTDKCDQPELIEETLRLKEQLRFNSTLTIF